MSWRAYFCRPGGGVQDAYLKVYHRLTGVYRPDEIAPIPPSTFETVRDDFPDVAALTLSRPPQGPRGDWMEAGDWVRIWLPGDAENDPTYLGEITNDPWFEGQGTVNLRSLKSTVGKAAWSAPLAPDGTRPLMTGKFRDFMTQAITLAAPSVPIGSIPDDPADMAGNPDFETLETTLKNAEYVIDNGSSGVSAAGTLDIRRPDTAIHFNFREWLETTPGTWENYYNCLRFPFTRPDGTEGIHAGRNVAEVARRGQEVWDQTNVPSRLQAAQYVALQGQGADVTTYVKVGGSFPNQPHVNPAVPAVATRTEHLPVFDSTWAGHLYTPAPVKIGKDYVPTDAQDSRLWFDVLPFFVVGGSLYYWTPEVVAVNPVSGSGLGAGNFEVCVYADPNAAGVAASDANKWFPAATGDGSKTLSSNEIAIQLAPNNATNLPPRTSITGMGLRYSQAWLNAHPNFPGIDLVALAWSSQTYQDNTGQQQPMILTRAITITSPVAVGDSRTRASVNFNPYYQNIVPPPKLSGALSDTVFIEKVSVTVAPGIAWEPSSAIQASTGDGAAVTVTVNDGVALNVLPNPPAGTQRWAYQGSHGVTLTSINFAGDVSRLGRLQLEVMDTARLDMYAAARLARYTQPERNWTGWGYELRRVPCRGSAQFAYPPGDQVLDVQRVRYNLLPGPGEKAWVVECGTAYPSEDEDAILNALESVKREAQA